MSSPTTGPYSNWDNSHPTGFLSNNDLPPSANQNVGCSSCTTYPQNGQTGGAGFSFDFNNQPIPGMRLPSFIAYDNPGINSSGNLKASTQHSNVGLSGGKRRRRKSKMNGGTATGSYALDVSQTIPGASYPIVSAYGKDGASSTNFASLIPKGITIGGKSRKRMSMSKRMKYRQSVRKLFRCKRCRMMFGSMSKLKKHIINHKSRSSTKKRIGKMIRRTNKRTMKTNLFKKLIGGGATTGQYLNNTPFSQYYGMNGELMNPSLSALANPIPIIPNTHCGAVSR
jgi:hypothetical protein